MAAAFPFENYIIVAAIDFGTTYSGYAYSMRDRPHNIFSNQQWYAGGRQLISLKTPTCVLINPQEELDSFGFEAENKYVELAHDDRHKDWFFFQNFKMTLYHDKVEILV